MTHQVGLYLNAIHYLSGCDPCDCEYYHQQRSKCINKWPNIRIMWTTQLNFLMWPSLSLPFSWRFSFKTVSLKKVPSLICQSNLLTEFSHATYGSDQIPHAVPHRNTNTFILTCSKRNSFSVQLFSLSFGAKWNVCAHFRLLLYVKPLNWKNHITVSLSGLHLIFQ